MSSGFRKNIARSISGLEVPETYLVNRKLAAPKNRLIKDEGFVFYIQSTDDIKIKFKTAKTIYSAYFYEGKNNGVKEYITFENPKVVPLFFAISAAAVNSETISLLKAEYFNLNELLLREECSVISLQKDLPALPTIYKFSSLALSAQVEEINFQPECRAIYNLQPNINLPDTKDMLASLIPAIEKLDLLGQADFTSSTNIFTGKDFNFESLSEFPVTTEISGLDISNNLSLHQYNHLFISPGNIMGIETPALKFENINIAPPVSFKFCLPDTQISNYPNLIDNPILNLSDKYFYRFLEPVYELSDKIKNEMLSVLPAYQQTGAATLADSDFAFFNDEFELGKEVQAIMAIKMLLRIRAAKRILIITSREKEIIGDPHGNPQLAGLWQGQLKTLLHEFDHKFFIETGSVKSAEIFNNNIINGMSYEVFEECFFLGILSPEKLNIFDCIIFDDTSPETLQLDSIKNSAGSLISDYIWFLSDFDDALVIEKIKTLFPNKSITAFGRSKNEINSGLPRRRCFDFFTEINFENRETAAKIYSDGRERIDDLIGLGNIFRIQPNAFQIIQDFQRRTNFIPNTFEGKKTNLLKYNLARVLARNDRTLVYSQYDDSGLKQIGQLLEQLGISYLKFTPNDTKQELDEKLAIARIEKGKMVYITNLKPNAIRFKFPDVSHLINFDNWCNPAVRWGIEDKLNCKTGEGITVYNYFYKHTLESRLINDMTGKGLWDKNFADIIPAEKFYEIFDENYWTDLFELIHLGMTKEITAGEDNSGHSFSNLIELAEAVKQLLTRIGYKEVVAFSDIKDFTFNVTAKIVVNEKVRKLEAKCFYNSFLNSETVRETLDQMECTADNCRILLVTNGIISRTKIILPPNVSLVDGKRLKYYLNIF